MISEQTKSNEEKLIHTMQLLGDKTRFQIFKLLINNENLCVSQIAERLNISVSAVSQHFRNFEIIGLVTKRRDGQKICYELKNDDELVKKISKLAIGG